MLPCHNNKIVVQGQSAPCATVFFYLGFPESTNPIREVYHASILYRSAKVTLNQDKVRETEEYYDRYAAEGANEHQFEERQKAVVHRDMIIVEPDRRRAVTEDFIGHYEFRVREGTTVAGKAILF